MHTFTKVGLDALLTPENCAVLLIDHRPPLCLLPGPAQRASGRGGRPRHNRAIVRPSVRATVQVEACRAGSAYWPPRAEAYVYRKTGLKR